QTEPIFLTRETLETLYSAAEAVAGAFDEAVRLCAREPTLVEEFFGLPPWHRLMWQASGPRWHGIARAEVCLRPDGPGICEINCDTRGGEAEAVLLGRAAGREHPECEDPSAALEERFCALVEAVAPPRGGRGVSAPRSIEPPTVGIVYP